MSGNVVGTWLSSLLSWRSQLRRNSLRRQLQKGNQDATRNREVPEIVAAPQTVTVPETVAVPLMTPELSIRFGRVKDHSEARRIRECVHETFFGRSAEAEVACVSHPDLTHYVEPIKALCRKYDVAFSTEAVAIQLLTAIVSKIVSQM